jgi:hypothetical protein
VLTEEEAAESFVLTISIVHSSYLPLRITGSVFPYFLYQFPKMWLNRKKQREEIGERNQVL